MHTARHARPRSRARAYILAGLAAFLAAALITAIGARLITFDHMPGLAGVSVGTDTHYCSADFIANALTWSCETSQ